MTSKVNINQVIRRHFDTFKDKEMHYKPVDLFLFFGIPGILSLTACFYSYEFTQAVISNLINIEALLSGLLLNLLVLVYSLKERTPKVNVEVEGWKELQLKHQVVNEVFFNVAFSTLTGFIMLILTVLHNFADGISIKGVYLNGNVIDPLIIFFGFNLILNFMMIIKRISALFCNEGD
ncbi:hypothetical protein [Shewanella psychrotolerans]|uniref:hypothetical protein n=1 Tax=Shewanella psychrotolerans TaxID=2864206 RepID=UPI001C659464|nr:hypothetical protein [Shewanella psychrotolerans]QYK02793.1 hypothetical protein K0I62_07600 [Shewanella psychrotolerans]